MCPLRLGQLVGIDDPQRERSRRFEPAERRGLAEHDPGVAVGGPVAHHARDHRRALVGGHGRVVRLELGRLVLQRVIGDAGLVGQQHGEQLGRVTDPLAEHAEVARPDRIVVHEAHPVQPARPVGGGVEGRVGDGVVEGHAVDGRHPDRAGHGDDLGPRPVGEEVVVADRRAARGRR